MSNKKNYLELPIIDLPELRQSPSALRGETEKLLGVHLPDDYVEFISRHNGAMGYVGDSSIRLFAFQTLYQWNHDQRVSEAAPQLIFFASNGAEELYAFDKRVEPMRIVQVPRQGMSMRDALLCGTNFAEFLNYLERDEVGPHVDDLE